MLEKNESTKLTKYIKWLVFIFSLLLIGIFIVREMVFDAPEGVVKVWDEGQLVRVDTNHYQLGNNWLRKAENGNWESYIEGDANARGNAIGILHQALIQQQETAFIAQIDEQIPSWFFKRILLLSIGWFNRDLDENIPLEFRQEIYGLSSYFSGDYDYIGPKYNRVINYHAAHDIGHAAQNMHLVACTSVGAWQFDDSTAMMLSGRNFDFYFGEEFAKDKIVQITNPEKGFKYISVTWGGFCGVVSGLNEKGLSVTLNAAKSGAPSGSGTPVSIISREILQYASNVAEAEQIASKYQSFVSELFTISSLEDQEMVVLEKTPDTLGVYRPEADQLIVTNHFQSRELADSELNLEHLSESESGERFERTQELVAKHGVKSPLAIAKILRDQLGVGDQNIGVGNPETINQLLAHHAVVMDNVNLKIWVSNSPYQINSMEAYDLNDFERWGHSPQFPITDRTDDIAADPFFESTNHADFEAYKALKVKVMAANKSGEAMEREELIRFETLNPNYYETHRLLGIYYQAQDEKDLALRHYRQALSKKIAYLSDSIFIENEISNLNQ